MGDQWDQDPHTTNNNNTGRPTQDDIDKQLKEIRRVVAQGANEAQVRIKRVVDKAGDYWQQVQTPPTTPRQASSVEEQRLRQLINAWSNENWRVARELGIKVPQELLYRADEVIR